MQDQQSRQAGDARLRVLSSGWIAKAIAIGCALTVICTLSVLLSAFRLTGEAGVKALSNDFRVFWSAGTLALQGEYLAVFDTKVLTAVHNVNPDDWMPWLYPPGFLLLLAPFGALSYATGFAILSLLSCVCIALAMRPFVTGSGAAWAAFSLAPAYLPILAAGQNGLIWLAGLIAALAALRDGRWVLAGVLIGLLTLKPQFGLLIPVALLAAGLWRTTLVATLTAVVVAVLPTLATGTDYWFKLGQVLVEHGQRVMASIQSLESMASPYSLLVRLGSSPETALRLQAGVTVATGLAVFAVWRSGRVDFDVKAACLLTACLVASPYAWHYESAFMAPVALFLLRAGILETRPRHLFLLAPLWFGAAIQAVADLAAPGGIHFRWAFLVTPVMLLCLGLCLIQVWQSNPGVAARRQERP
jgi:arabinofuranan 3-O-arabinosyltransferase